MLSVYVYLFMFVTDIGSILPLLDGTVRNGFVNTNLDCKRVLFIGLKQMSVHTNWRNKETSTLAFKVHMI